MGSLQPTSETVTNVSNSKGEKFDISDLAFNNKLPTSQINELKTFLNDYQDTFASNSKSLREPILLSTK